MKTIREKILLIQRFFFYDPYARSVGSKFFSLDQKIFFTPEGIGMGMGMGIGMGIGMGMGMGMGIAIAHRHRHRP